MASKGYCDASHVEAWYGKPLTPAEEAQVLLWLEPAEATVDQATGHPYLTGPVLGERLPCDGPVCWLAQRPLVTVQAVRGYLRGQAALQPALISPADYEIDDAARATLYIRGWQSWAYLRVDYTPSATLPPQIGEATAMLLADWLTAEVMAAAGAAGGGAIRRKTVADLTIEYTTASPVPSSLSSGLSERVRLMLRPWTDRVGFA